MRSVRGACLLLYALFACLVATRSAGQADPATLRAAPEVSAQPAHPAAPYRVGTLPRADRHPACEPGGIAAATQEIGPDTIRPSWRETGPALALVPDRSASPNYLSHSPTAPPLRI